MSSFPEANNLQRGKRNPGRKDRRGRSFSITLLAFVLVGSVFLYFVNWFSEARRNRSDEVVQAATIIVLKKLPPVVGSELVSILSNKGMEYQSAVRSEKKAVMDGGPHAVDSRGMPIVVKKSLPTMQDGRLLPETTPSGDFIYDAAFVNRAKNLADACFFVDSKFVDGAVNGTAATTRGTATLSKLFDTYVVDGLVNFIGWINMAFNRIATSLQTGLVQRYALGALFGIVVFILIYYNDFLKP